MRRRKVLQAASTLAVTGVAGCVGSGGELQGRDVEFPWTRLPGPPGGPVLDVGVSAADPEWLYAATITAGIYASSDGGRSWIQGTESMHHRSDIWVSPHDPEVALTRVDSTTDGGRTWSTGRHGGDHSCLPHVDEVFDLAFDRADERTRYAATNDGLYRTSDGPCSWSRVDSAPIGNAGEVWRVAAHPEREGSVVAAAREEAVYRSDDGGESWSEVRGTDRISDNLPRYLEFADPDSEETYVAINGAGIYRLGGGGPLDITEDLGSLAFGGNPAARSVDGGALYFAARRMEASAERGELFVYEPPTDEIRTVDTPEEPLTVTAHPRDPSTVFLGGRSWVYESRDGGESWSELSNGFVDRYLATVGTNDSRPGTVIAGSICSTGLSVSHDDGDEWFWKRSGLEPFHDGEFNEHYLMHVAANGDRVYATTAAGLLISEDNGETWRLLENEFSGEGTGDGEGGARHLHGLAVDPADPHVVYVGTGLGDAGSHRDYFDGESYIWKSEDGGRTWRQITDGYPVDRDTAIQDILVSAHDSSTVYVGTNAEDYIAGGTGDGTGVGIGAFRSNDGGSRWEKLQMPIQNVHSLTEDAADPNVLYASSPRGVYRSPDGGDDWEAVLPHETKALLAHPDQSGVVFAGTQKYPKYWDVLVTEDGGETWGEGNLTIQVGRGPADREFDGMDLHAGYRSDFGQIMWFSLDEATSYLYAATRGAGLWRSDTSGTLERGD